MMEHKITFKLGQEVRVKARLKVQKRWEKGVGTRRRYDVVDEKMPLYGVVVGIRTLREGKIECYDDEGCHFYPTRHIRAVLVAVSLNCMVRALPEDLEIVEEGE